MKSGVVCYHSFVSVRVFWLLIPGILYLLSLNAYYVGFFNDDAFFLIGAKSLLSGRYAELNHPANPPFIQYLPGYPLLLAPWMLLPGADFLGPKLFSVLMTLSAVFLFHRFAREELSPTAAAAATALLAFNPLTVSLSGVILSDVPSLLWTVLILITARAWWKRDDDKAWILLGLMGAFGFFLRPTGAAFILTLPLALAWEKRYRQALIALTAGTLPILAWLTRNWIVRGHGLLYADELADPYKKATADALIDAGNNAWFYLRELFGRVLFRQPLTLVSTALGACFCIAGIVRIGITGWRFFALAYAAAYGAVIILWPKQTSRYLLPILPFILWWMFAGAARLEEDLKKPKAVTLALLLFGLVCAAPPVFNIVRTSTTRETPVNTPPRKFWNWVRTNTDPNALFAAELDGRTYILSDRHCLQLPRWKEPGRIAQWAMRNKVDYIITTDNRFVMRTHRGEGPHDAVTYADLPFAAAYKDSAGTIYKIK